MSLDEIHAKAWAAPQPISKWARWLSVLGLIAFAAAAGASLLSWLIRVDLDRALLVAMWCLAGAVFVAGQTLGAWATTDVRRRFLSDAEGAGIARATAVHYWYKSDWDMR